IDATVTVTGYIVPYDSHPPTCLTTSTSHVCSSDRSFTLTGTTHTGAGTYNGDAWSFSGGTNYNDKSGTVDDKISKIDATVTVTRSEERRVGNEDTATAAAAGPGGARGGSVTLTAHT